MKKIGRFDNDNPKCPRCLGEDLDYDTYEPVDESFKQEIYCNSCGADFTIYAFKPRYWDIWAENDFFHVEVKKE